MSDRRETRIGDWIENRQKSLRRDRVERAHDAIGSEHRGTRRVEGHATSRAAASVKGSGPAGAAGRAAANNWRRALTSAAQRMRRSYCQLTRVSGLAFEARMNGGMRIVVRLPFSPS
jgi:hypothetical protein